MRLAATAFAVGIWLAVLLDGQLAVVRPPAPVDCRAMADRVHACTEACAEDARCVWERCLPLLCELRSRCPAQVGPRIELRR